MRAPAGLLILAIAGCGGGSTDVAPMRYNFGIIDGKNQSGIAGVPALAKPVTSQLTRDPQGKFATRVFDFLAPAIAYAQGLTIPGDPVANQIVCGEETATGEPKVVPLCAFTLADGKAANVVQTGTKAGVYTMRFTAQVSTQVPVKDSTTVTVQAGAVAQNAFADRVTYGCWVSPATFPGDALKDRYGNLVEYKLIPSGGVAHAKSDVAGPDGRTLIADKDGSGTVQAVATDGTAVGTAVLTVGGSCISLAF